MSATSQLLLPFAEKDYVDVAYVARVLGIAPRRVLELIAEGVIDAIDYAPNRHKRVRYQGLVEFCDELRRLYSIPDRRPPLPASYFRHAPDTLLPFPIEDTISVEEVCQILGYDSETSVYRLIEEGRFEVYQLTRSSPWRISRTSFAAFIERSRRATSRPSHI